MLDINKIQGILSARDGTLIPKFLKPGSPIFDIEGLKKDLEVVKKDPNADPEYIKKLEALIAAMQSGENSGNIEKSTVGPNPGQGTITPTIQSGAEQDKLKVENAPALIDATTWEVDDDSPKTIEEPKVIEKSEVPKEKLKFDTKVAAGVASKGLDIAGAMVRSSQDYASDDPTINGAGRQAYDAVASSLMGFSPVGTVIGGAMKAAAIVNDIAGKKSQDFAADQDTLNTVGGSYGGSSDLIHNAESKAGKKYGLLGNSARKRANRLINEARRQQTIMADIAKDSRDMQDASTIMAQSNGLGYQYLMNGGYDLRYLRALQGAKIDYFENTFTVDLTDCPYTPELSDCPIDFSVTLSDTPELFKKGGTILDQLDKLYSFNVVLSEISEIDQFKKGGQVKEREIEVIETDTNQKSVIPEGALHKNKHHLDQVGIDDSELTKKGIPVIDNLGNLQAEIELNEIIFTLEVTKELEKRYKEYYEEDTTQAKKDELALEAGKLLWKEIIYNTDDRTGIISTLKKGGSIEAPIVKEKPEPAPSIPDNIITQEYIDKLVKLALINIFTK